MTESAHLGDAIHEVLDGRLAPEAQARAEAHLAECTRCRQELEALRWVKALAARGAAKRDVPPALASTISSALDREDRGVSTRMAVPWRMPRPALALGLLALVTVAMLLWRGRGVTDLPSAVARDYSRYREATLPLGLRTADTRRLQEFFAASGITFETRVFDLGMMGYRVVGGRVHALDRRPSALFVYEGEGGRLLLCQMFEGRLAELPPAEVVREHNGIRFHVHHRGGLNLVFWQEGDVVCVLASEIAAEEVIQLAFAKAVRVARAGLEPAGPPPGL
jgi:anti-sigma factor RsiW